MMPGLIDVENHANGTSVVVFRMYGDGVDILYTEDVADADILPEAEQGDEEKRCKQYGFFHGEWCLIFAGSMCKNKFFLRINNCKTIHFISNEATGILFLKKYLYFCQHKEIIISKMKILMLLDHPFPPDTRVENEIKSLAEARHEVHIACFHSEGKALLEKTEHCTIHRFPISKFMFKASVGVLKFPFYFNYWRKIVNGLFAEMKFDAVHVHDLPLARIGYEAKCNFGAKFVLDLHENWPVLLQLSKHTNTFLGKLLSSDKQWVEYEKKMCLLADKVIVVVDEAKNRVCGLGVAPEKVVVVSNTLNIGQFDPIERKEFKTDKFRMLYVGGINYHRGIQNVIRAISILKKRGVEVHFDLVGDGSYLADIRRLIEELQVQDNVTVHGFKHYTQICNLYESANVAMIPHVKSGHTDNTIPHKIFQYMYAEIPMIVSNCDPLVRIVNETKSGITYRFDNSEELAEVIANFHAHPESLNNYIKHGRQAVIDKYNWKVDGAKLVKLYEDLR